MRSTDHTKRPTQEFIISHDVRIIIILEREGRGLLCIERKKKFLTGEERPRRRRRQTIERGRREFETSEEGRDSLGRNNDIIIAQQNTLSAVCSRRGQVKRYAILSLHRNYHGGGGVFFFVLEIPRS